MGRSFAASADSGRGAASLAFALLAICALGALAYANTLFAPFVFDDWRAIADNPFIRWTAIDLRSLRFTLANSPLTHAVPSLSFALNYRFGGYAPFGYHLLNLALHLANACLVFALARITLARVAALPDQAGPALPAALRPWLALACALVFVAHPLQTQAVSYTALRATLLCAFFYLAALWLFVQGRLATAPRARAACFAGCAAAGLLALGSTPGAATLPLALYLFDLFFLRDLRRSPRAEVALLLFLSLCAGACVARGGLALLGADANGLGGLERLLTQARVIWLYASLIALPLPSRLNVAHDVAASHGLLDPATTLPALLGLVAALAFAVIGARRRRLISFAILWFLLQLALESSVLPLERVAESRTYLPLAGVSLALALPLARLAAWRPAVARVATFGLVLLLALGSALRNQAWSNELLLWSDAAAKSPELPRAHTNLGVAYARAGMHEEAIASYERAVALDPDSAEIHYDLVFSLRAVGRETEAQRELDEALRLQPEHAGALHLLGEAALRRGDFTAAAGHFEAALRADTRLAPSYHQLGIALIGSGRLEDAAAPLKAAARLDPRLADSARQAFASASANRGLERLAVGDQAGAATDLRAALEAAPHDAISANALAWILATSADPTLRDAAGAVQTAELAQRERPEDADFLDTLGAAYAAAGRFEEAVAVAEKADALASARGDDGLRDRIRERLRHYRAGEAWIEGS